MIKKYSFLLLLFISNLVFAIDKPNLVLFLADDCTYRDIGVYGSKNAITPNIDNMARNGLQFNNCYQAAPMCSPTRHNILTGMYPVRTGAYPNHTNAYSHIKSMPNYLKELGYRVAHVGKRHFGPSTVFPFEFLGDKVKGKEYIDLDLVQKFMKECKENNQPFCIFICSHQPHGPYTLGDSSKFPPSSLVLQDNQVDTPQFREKLSKYYAEINFLDNQVGTVLKQLKDNKLDQNTLTIFLSEQGSSFALSKWTCYEDGLKSAFIARWPGVINPGTTSNALIEYNDILPTFIEAAGGTPPNKLDGESLISIFKKPKRKGKKYAFSIQTTRGIILGSDYFGIRSVTDGKYRYIYNLSPEVQFSNGDIPVKNPDHWFGSWKNLAKTDTHAKKIVDHFLYRPQEELYNVKTDPSNLKNLADNQAFKAKKEEMKKALLEWMTYCGDEGLKTELLALERINFARNVNTPEFEIGKFHEALNPKHKIKEKYVTGKNFNGYIDIPTEGYYSFYKKKNRGLSSTITVDGKPLVIETKKSTYGIIPLKKGLHKIEIVADGREKVNDLTWSGPNILPRPFTKADLFTSQKNHPVKAESKSNTIDSNSNKVKQKKKRRKNKQPNIIVIFTDDQGYQDLSSYGSPKISTPELDQMAKEGIRFTDFYVGASVCSSSRASILTGRTALRHKIGAAFFPSGGSMNTNEITIAEVLKTVGYKTAMYGKWHLGDDKDSVLPIGQGFDEYYGIPFSNDMYINPDHKWADNVIYTQGYDKEKALRDQKIALRLRNEKKPYKDHIDNGLVNKVPIFEKNKIVEYPAYQPTLTKRYFDRAIQFVDETEDPFFIMITPAMPHTPLFASDDFKGKSKRGQYGDVVEEIDYNVGRLLKHLKVTGQDKNTMVIFTSDNGPWLGKGIKSGSAAPLKDGKFSTFEGGVRVPGIAWWPKKWAKGKVSNQIVSTLDLFPTFIHYAGAENPNVEIDGYNISKLLENPKKKTPRPYFIYTKRIGISGVRKGDWKYLRNGGSMYQKKSDPAELYNLKKDIGEQNNVIDQYPEIVAELEAILKKEEQSAKK